MSGNISSVGSVPQTCGSVGGRVGKLYPNVNIQIQAAGSSTAPPALTEGTSNLGPMSRKMKDNEIDDFESKHGYKPTAIPVAIDALAVFVNKDNPVKGLSIPQVDAIMSSTRKCGHATDITTWGEAGLTGGWAGKPIQLYGRNSVSGTYGFFKDEALCKGDFKNNVNEQPGSASVVQAVTTSSNGISYSGIGYSTSGVKAIRSRPKKVRRSSIRPPKTRFPVLIRCPAFCISTSTKSPTNLWRRWKKSSSRWCCLKLASKSS